MPRQDGRALEDLRPIKVTKDFMPQAEGSCLIEFGNTRVICSASVEENVPPWLRNSGTGWVTAEYGMLPRSTGTRVSRDKMMGSGRTMEIQRLVGRSLRAVVDLSVLGERTVKVDCDVINADGGTRTASITGGFIALALAFGKLKKQGIIAKLPLLDYVAAISVGNYSGDLMMDLNYGEDSKAEMDMNVVMVGKGNFVEVQGTAEGQPFSKEEMDALLDLAREGIRKLIGIQRSNLEGINLG